MDDDAVIERAVEPRDQFMQGWLYAGHMIMTVEGGFYLIKHKNSDKEALRFDKNLIWDIYKLLDREGLLIIEKLLLIREEI